MQNRIFRLIEYAASALVTKKKRFNLAILNFLPDQQLQIILQQCNQQVTLLLQNVWQSLAIEFPMESVHPDIRGNILLFALIKQKKFNADILMLMRMITLLNGFDINYQERVTGNTALILAAKYDRTKVIEFLILHSAEINTTNYHHESAALWAIKNNNSAALERLVTAGANLRIQDTHGHSLLEMATFHGDLRIMRLITIFSAQNELDKALLIAARAGDINKINDLIFHGAKVTTALEVATEKEHYAAAAIIAKEYFKSYQIKRKSQAMFTGSIFGCSRTTKVNAANAMIHVLSLPVAAHHTLVDHLNAHSHLLKAHHRALHQGELGKMMMQLLKTSMGNLEINRFTLRF